MDIFYSRINDDQSKYSNSLTPDDRQGRAEERREDGAIGGHDAKGREAELATPQLARTASHAAADQKIFDRLVKLVFRLNLYFYRNLRISSIS